MGQAYTPRSFEADLARSVAVESQLDHTERLARIFNVTPDRITKTGSRDEKHGIDYLVDIGHHNIAVDVKERALGASRYWSRGIPQIAVEDSSVITPTTRIAGPLYRTNQSTDILMYCFADIPHATYLVNAQQLRAAALDGRFDRFPLRSTWSMKNGEQYESTVRFVPVTVVSAATGAMWFDDNSGQPIKNFSN